MKNSIKPFNKQKYYFKKYFKCGRLRRKFKIGFYLSIKFYSKNNNKKSLILLKNELEELNNFCI